MHGIERWTLAFLITAASISIFLSLEAVLIKQIDLVADDQVHQVQRLLDR